MNPAETRTRGLYRSKHKCIAGVCSGIAEYFDFSVGWVRFITLILLFMSGIWPILGIYMVASLVMKPSPVYPLQTEEEREFYDTYANAPGFAAERLKHRFNQLDRRIRRMEDSVTRRDYDWEERL